MGEGAPKPYEPSHEEIDKGYDTMTDQQEHDTQSREDRLHSYGNELQLTGHNFRLDVQQSLDAYDKRLALAEQEAIAKEPISPELSRETEEAKRIAAEIRQKLAELEAVFKSGRLEFTE